MLTSFQCLFLKPPFHSIDELIGCGNFGDVYKGTWRKNDQEVLNVAVKKLRESEGGELSMKFLQEAAIMGQFNHPNIVRLHGVVDNEEGDELELVSDEMAMLVLYEWRLTSISCRDWYGLGFLYYVTHIPTCTDMYRHVPTCISS